MRIGEVARRTGLSARMIRYHDDRGHLPGRTRTAGRHRYFDQSDLDWLSGLRALLAAGVPTATAVRALQDRLTETEREEIDAAVARLGSHVALARDRLADEPGYRLGFEERMTLAFDTFVMRTRMESYLFAALQPAGVMPGDFGLLSIVAEAELTPAVLSRMVGVAPSTLSRRLGNLVERGWVARRPTGGNGRSWVATLTPAGREVLATAHPAFVHIHERLDAELRRRGVEPELLRRQIQVLSTTLRSLLPDEDQDGSGAAGLRSGNSGNGQHSGAL